MKNKEHYMWFGVIFLTAIIVALWGYALFILAKNTNFRHTAEGELLKTTKKNWDTIFIETKSEEKKKQSVEQIKQIISQLMATSTTNTNLTTTTNTTVTTTKL